ncbi:MAG TPA: DUF177 domain-containing protein [Bryobacteraceae bacterium]|nr:DUF177 domain-containing protein [Bryobacteraceae bacterium]
MFFHIRDLEVRAGRFDLELKPGEIEFFDPKLRQSGPLKAAGKVELVTGAIGEIRVQGRLSMTMEADCDRCLEPAQFPLDSDFELYYRPVAETAAHEVAIDDSEAEIGFYEGDGIELNEVLREYILLALPMQRVCRADCKGICPSCGQNRNQKECGCQVEAVDDRWASLKNYGR